MELLPEWWYEKNQDAALLSPLRPKTFSLHQKDIGFSIPKYLVDKMTDSTAKKIAVITDSTRVVRTGTQVTKFVKTALEDQLLRSSENHKYTLHEVDIASFKPPVFDEEVSPAAVPFMAQFAHEHSKAWSADISKYDGYILVTACYARPDSCKRHLCSKISTTENTRSELMTPPS